MEKKEVGTSELRKLKYIYLNDGFYRVATKFFFFFNINNIIKSSNHT